MHVPHPKSFFKLILLGFFLVVLPLLIALGYAAVYVDRLSDQSQYAVYQTARVTQRSRKLVEEIVIMERNARQFQILGDLGLFDSYEKNHNKFQETAAGLSELSPDTVIKEKLTALISKEQEVYKIFRDNAYDSIASKAAVVHFVELSDLARNIQTRNNRVIDGEVRILRKTAANAKTIFFWISLALIPVTILIAGGFVVVIARPIRQIEQAIIQLGRGKFTTSIKVSGPQDLEYLGQRLDWLRLRLAEVEEEKEKFLKHVSHELKTPLSSIHEGTELLVDGVVGQLGPEQREVVEILKVSTGQLKRLIENLLNFRMSHLKQPVLQHEKVNLSRLMEQVINDQKLQIIAKDLQLKTELIPISVQGDREKLRVMFDNLLSNGIKYSPRKGTIDIAIKQNDSWAILNIKDEGPGIEEDEKDRIFEAFYQGRAVTDSHIKGTGLGLAIVREYIEGHGGNIEVMGSDHSGAHLCLRIPL